MKTAVMKLPFVSCGTSCHHRLLANSSGGITMRNAEAEIQDALNRLPAETAAELDALLPTIRARAFKGEL
jgi:hypothetical protein